MRGILYLSTLEWDHIWNRQHELASRFAAAGHPVAWVEPLGIREPRWRDDWPRVVQRLRQVAGPRPAPRPTPPLLHLVAPLVLPLHGRRWARALNRRLLGAALGRALRWTGPAPLIWTLYATEMVLDIRAMLPGSPTIFDCTDEIALNHKGVARNYRETERALLAAADETIVTSQPLFAAKQPHARSLHLIGPGANVAPFLAPPAALPADLAALPAPRLLFFGGIDERLDLRLLRALADARPDWQIVLIGPRKTDLDTLLAAPNAHWLGPKAHEALPAYLAAADVLLIPYVQDAYTHFVFPTKIFECLASGRPTVATPLPDLRPLAPHVTLAEGRDGWLAAIEAALAPAAQSPAASTARRAIAAQQSWDQRFAEISHLVAPLLHSPAYHDDQHANPGSEAPPARGPQWPSSGKR